MGPCSAVKGLVWTPGEQGRLMLQGDQTRKASLLRRPLSFMSSQAGRAGEAGTDQPHWATDPTLTKTGEEVGAASSFPHGAQLPFCPV